MLGKIITTDHIPIKPNAHKINTNNNLIQAKPESSFAIMLFINIFF
jgi:hypothetical protein